MIFRVLVVFRAINTFTISHKKSASLGASFFTDSKTPLTNNNTLNIKIFRF